MPFKSLAQKQRFQQMVQDGSMSQDTFNQFSQGTPDDNQLPDRITIKTKPKKHKRKKSR